MWTSIQHIHGGTVSEYDSQDTGASISFSDHKAYAIDALKLIITFDF
jgi:hypothetical protein